MCDILCPNNPITAFSIASSIFDFNRGIAKARQNIYPFPVVSPPLPLLCSFNLSFSIKLFHQIFNKSKFGK